MLVITSERCYRNLANMGFHMATSALAPAFNTAHAPRWVDRGAAFLGVCTSLAQDPDEHAQNLTAWEQLYDQLSCGRFSGSISEMRLPAMQVFRESTSRSLRQSCRVWDDSFWFGIPDRPALHVESAGASINGRRHGHSEIMVRPGAESFELFTPDAHSLYGVVVQRDALVQAAAAQGCHVDWDALQHAELLRVEPAAMGHCIQVLSTMLHIEPVQSQHAEHKISENLQSVVLDALLHMLDNSGVDADVRHSIARRQSVVARARAMLLSKPDHPVTIAELCEQLHVSRRTLQYCFEDTLGVSPLPFLRSIRLNGARRHLREPESVHRSVQDVAAHWGFWHMSQFATDYKKLFGEMPSTTLKNRKASALHAGRLLV